MKATLVQARNDFNMCKAYVNQLSSGNNSCSYSSNNSNSNSNNSSSNNVMLSHNIQQFIDKFLQRYDPSYSMYSNTLNLTNNDDNDNNKQNNSSNNNNNSSNSDRFNRLIQSRRSIIMKKKKEYQLHMNHELLLQIYILLIDHIETLTSSTSSYIYQRIISIMSNLLPYNYPDVTFYQMRYSKLLLHKIRFSQQQQQQQNQQKKNQSKKKNSTSLSSSSSSSISTQAVTTTLTKEYTDMINIIISTR
jgi:hypothetical protein